jgi:flagellar basal body P-ring formation protein FlgA
MRTGKLILMLSTVWLMYTGVTAQAEETGKVIADLVMQTYGFDSTTYQVEIVSSQLKTKLVNREDVSFRALTPQPPMGPFPVLVTIADSGAVIEKGQVRLTIRRFGDVLVALGDIARYETLTPDQFELRRMEVTSLREQSVGSIEDIQGQRSKVSLRKGNILTMANLESIPDIEVGGEVTIVYDDGRCKITAPGKALQSGSAGTRVRVKNTASGKILMARVIDQQLVAVGP